MYDHDAKKTYHMRQYSASKWNEKIAEKRSSIEGGKSRQIPFTLSEIHCKEQSRAIEKLKIGSNTK